ncbi:5555_t:CDS:2 [Paraglomus occultum]|uniref:5555_t:CDS:1 n=1 Tax=Paraglomus occultum TaxID=144539 RepID=A0A9N9GBN8_9GLOM|nr:5555_t:CDS:2 [Paraglomus occultum]
MRVALVVRKSASCSQCAKQKREFEELADKVDQIEEIKELDERNQRFPWKSSRKATKSIKQRPIDGKAVEESNNTYNGRLKERTTEEELHILAAN